MNWKDIEPQVLKLNTGLLNLMEQIKSLSSKDRRYPKTSEAFNTAYDHLEHPTYDIVVCGEVKKGKSRLCANCGKAAEVYENKNNPRSGNRQNRLA